MNKEYKPTISIIMGAYNCEATIAKSIESIINQSFVDWEFIICDDGSIDNSYNIAKYYEKKDSRIKVIKNDINKGLAYSLNRCIDISCGEYIARQDSDDYSHERRLEEELNFLKKNNEYGFVSTGAYLFDNDGIWGERNTKSYSPTKIELAKTNVFIHPTILAKKEIINSVKNYSVEKYTYRTEDYDLWFKIYSKNIKGYIMSDKLHYFREDRNSFSRKKFKYRLDEVKVRLNGYRNMNIEKKYYVLAFKPILIGIIPKNILRLYHRSKAKF